MSEIHEFSSASTLSVHASAYLYTLLGVCVYTRANLDEPAKRKRGNGGREKEKRNGAGDNNHNNLVKRYKDISR